MAELVGEVGRRRADPVEDVLPGIQRGRPEFRAILDGGDGRPRDRPMPTPGRLFEPEQQGPHIRFVTDQVVQPAQVSSHRGPVLDVRLQ